jgi:uncharacterized membrane protein YcaP (DUF421 family)
VLDWAVRNGATIGLLILLSRWVARNRLGKRGLIELLMINAIGDLASHTVFESQGPFYPGLASILFWTVAATIAAWLGSRWESFRHWYFGDRHEIIRNGIPDSDAMRLHRLSQAEVDSELRKHGIDALSEVKTATLELDGTMSVIKAQSTAQELRKLATALEALASRVEAQNHPQS